MAVITNLNCEMDHFYLKKKHYNNLKKKQIIVCII